MCNCQQSGREERTAPDDVSKGPIVLVVYKRA